MSTCSRSSGARRRRRTHGKHMKGARFTIPTPRCCRRPSTRSTRIPMEDRDTKGDVYEYMLSQDRHGRPERPVPHAAPHHPTDGRNDRADTDRHHLRPGLRHVPVPGRCRRVLRKHHPDALTDPARAEHFHNDMFHGFDFDNTMLRIGSMNMHAPRHRQPRHQLPRLARPRITPATRGRTPSPRQPSVRRLARLRIHRQGPTPGRQDQED